LFIFYNILEASTGAFYIKIMRFAGFFRVQIHSWNINVSSSLILSCFSWPFLLYYAICWNDGRKEENCGWEGIFNEMFLMTKNFIIMFWKVLWNKLREHVMKNGRIYLKNSKIWPLTMLPKVKSMVPSYVSFRIIQLLFIFYIINIV